MGFMRGQGAVRRIPGYLQRGKIIFKPDVRAVAMQWNPDDSGPANYGLGKFVFWHLPEMQYKNPRIHFGTFHKLTPTPWIKLFTSCRKDFTLDCDGRSRQEIHDALIDIFGRSEEEIRMRELAKDPMNPAGFGETYPKQCICEVPGQIPCPSWQALPREMCGKWHIRPGLKEQEEEA